MLDFLYSVNAKRALLAVLLLVIVILIATNLLLISLIIATSIILSFAVGRLNIKSVGIELVTFITVLSSLAYGPLAGGVIGLILITVHIAIPQYTGAYVIWVIPEYALAAAVAGMLGGSIASVGMTVTLLLNAINVFLTFIVYKEHLGRYLPYSITNVIFNIILFSYVAEPVLKMLK